LGNRYLWQGREISWRTGLYYFRQRWMDPVVGRWLSNDPIGISGGLNQYVFCANGPVNHRDPSGLFTFGWKGMVGIGGFGVAGASLVFKWGPGIIGGGIVGIAFTTWDMMDDWCEGGDVDKISGGAKDLITKPDARGSPTAGGAYSRNVDSDGLPIAPDTP